MAEALSSRTLCRYFVHGACRDGDLCRFSHDRQHKMDNVCRYYLKGCCSYGDRCRYDHIKSRGPVKDLTGCSPFSPKSKPLTHIPPPIQTSHDTSSGMVSLKKVLKGEKLPVTPKTPKSPEEWVHAVEFIPGQPYQCASIPGSYAEAACSGTDPEMLPPEEATDPSQLLCPFSTNKECPYGEDCAYIHGNICDLCGKAVLHPNNTEQQEIHRKECMEQHERDMEMAFAVARSQEKQCGICMDTVMEKMPPTEQRFGIMSDCTHCFCLACIRKWRNEKQYDSKTVRSCPECRVQSDFVTPSKYWVETKDEKIKLIDGYKRALSVKSCKYFDQGRGECPFNDKCFYLHAYPDGTRATVQPKKRRRRHNADGEMDLLQRIFLWDFLEERQNRLENLLLLEVEDELTSLLIDLTTELSLSSDESEDDFY